MALAGEAETGWCAKATNTSANAQSMRTANRQSFQIFRINASISVPH